MRFPFPNVSRWTSESHAQIQDERACGSGEWVGRTGGGGSLDTNRRLGTQWLSTSLARASSVGACWNSKFVLVDALCVRSSCSDTHAHAWKPLTRRAGSAPPFDTLGEPCQGLPKSVACYAPSRRFSATPRGGHLFECIERNAKI